MVTRTWTRSTSREKRSSPQVDGADIERAEAALGSRSRPTPNREETSIVADNIESRTGILEQIARSTEAILGEMRTDIREMRGEMRSDIRGIRDRQDSDFRALIGRQDRQFYWLFGVYLAGTATILGVMAHGFHWV